MRAMKNVGSAELKAGLSTHLAEVRGGERLMLWNRTTPVAWLVRYGDEDDALPVAPKASPLAIKRTARSGACA